MKKKSALVVFKVVVQVGALFLLGINRDDNEDTDCIQVYDEEEAGFKNKMNVWKMENVFLLFSNSFVYRFHGRVPMCALSPVGVACPDRGDLNTPGANQYQYSNVVAITKLQGFRWRKEGHHNLLC